MKKKFKDTKFGKAIKPVLNIGRSVLFGATGSTLKPIAGAIIGLKEGVMQEVNDNLNSENGGVAKVDYVRLLTSLFTIALIVLFITGVIGKEELEYILDLID